MAAPPARWGGAPAAGVRRRLAGMPPGPAAPPSHVAAPAAAWVLPDCTKMLRQHVPPPCKLEDAAPLQQAGEGGGGSTGGDLIRKVEKLRLG